MSRTLPDRAKPRDSQRKEFARLIIMGVCIPVSRPEADAPLSASSSRGRKGWRVDLRPLLGPAPQVYLDKFERAAQSFIGRACHDDHENGDESTDHRELYCLCERRSLSSMQSGRLDPENGCGDVDWIVRADSKTSVLCPDHTPNNRAIVSMFGPARKGDSRRNSVPSFGPSPASGLGGLGRRDGE